MARIGFIGMGNMGYALTRGLLSCFDEDDLIFSCKTREKREKIMEELGIMSAVSNAELVQACDIIVLAIKPQMYEEVFAEIRDHVHPGSMIISLAPGKSMEYIAEALGGNVRVVRAMPNTPALIGHGMTGVAYDESLYSDDEIHVIDQIFTSVGSYKKVTEEQMSAVVCASGSSPAYVYMFINELAQAAASKGLPMDTALEMVSQAVVGSAMMVMKTGENPEILKERVCSKGGTTIAGVNQLEELGFRGAIRAATDACYRRSEELAN